MTTTRKPATPRPPMLAKMIDDMLHSGGIPRCPEWERLESFAARMERERARLLANLSVVILANIDRGITYDKLRADRALLIAALRDAQTALDAGLNSGDAVSAGQEMDDAALMLRALLAELEP